MTNNMDQKRMPYGIDPETWLRKTPFAVITEAIHEVMTKKPSLQLHVTGHRWMLTSNC